MTGIRTLLIAGLLFGSGLSLPLASRGEPSTSAIERAAAQPAGPTTQSAAAPAPTSLTELLHYYAAMPGLEARFEEEKMIALLIEPLTSRGRLYFLPPTTLLRQVEAPRASEILVTENRVRLRAEDGTEETFDLTERSEIRPLVESLLWLFAGDAEALEAVYDADFTSNEAERTAEGGSWTLRLTPKEAPLDRLIRELHVRGTGPMTTSVEVVETSGDRSITRILEPNPERRFDRDDRHRLFGQSTP